MGKGGEYPVHAENVVFKPAILNGKTEEKPEKSFVSSQKQFSRIMNKNKSFFASV